MKDLAEGEVGALPPRGGRSPACAMRSSMRAARAAFFVCITSTDGEVLAPCLCRVHMSSAEPGCTLAGSHVVDARACAAALSAPFATSDLGSSVGSAWCVCSMPTAEKPQSPGRRPAHRPAPPAAAAPGPAAPWPRKTPAPAAERTRGAPGSASTPRAAVSAAAHLPCQTFPADVPPHLVGLAIMAGRVRPSGLDAADDICRHDMLSARLVPAGW